MKTMRCVSWALILMLHGALACAAEQQSRTIERKFEVDPAASPALEIDNVWGPIRVTGYQGRTIEMTARETVRADSAEKTEEARRDVKLDIKQDKNQVRLYVDGPFRCNCGEGRNSVSIRRHLGYSVVYDFEIRVPANTKLLLSTINDGQIKVENVSGDYDLNVINGRIDMSEVSGSGRAYALNGGLKAEFRANPKTNSSFGSLNGDVDLYFQPNLSADLRFKTFNGGVYTDFQFAALPAGQPTTERVNGKFVYKSDRFSRARVGQGGPEIKLDGFNGNIRVHQRTI